MKTSVNQFLSYVRSKYLKYFKIVVTYSFSIIPQMSEKREQMFSSHISMYVQRRGKKAGQ